MKKLLILFTLIPGLTIAQSAAEKWYFGSNAGLNFSAGKPYIIRGQSGYMKTQNRCSTVMSDTSGTVLFYSDGVGIWNGYYRELSDNLIGNTEMSQIVSVPIPNNKNEYLIAYSAGGEEAVKGWFYAVVSASTKKDGKLISENDTLLAGNYTQGAVVIPHKNQVDYWIVFHRAFGDRNEYEAVLIDSTGISNKVLSVGQYKVNPNRLVSTMSVNHKYTQIATTFYGQKNKGVCELIDFDNETGQVTDAKIQVKNILNRDEIFGVSFSPNDSLLYVTELNTAKLYQFEIASKNDSLINASKVMLGEENGIQIGQIQIGPDDKLYVNYQNRTDTRKEARVPPKGSSYIGVIHHPNKKGHQAKWEPEFLDYPGNFAIYSDLGLPSLRVFHRKPDTIQDIVNDTIVETIAVIDTIQNDNPDIQTARIGDTISFSNITFETSSFVLTNESKEILKTIAGYLNENPTINVEIVGHTDNSGDEHKNLLLSQERAKAVARYLKELSIDDQRMTSKGMGESSPKYDNSTLEGQKRNRRVEFIIR